MNETFDKMDIIIIIILALLVAFIIGFNIIQIIDNKLNNVVINVPPQNLPQILVNFDKDNKPIKLNDEQINIINKQINSENQYKKEDFTNNSEELDYTVLTNDTKENYGSVMDNYEERDDIHTNIFAQKIGSNLANEEINNKSNINPQDPNYNTIDNYPYLIDPSDSEDGYYQSRIKLISNKSSPLLKLQEKNMNKINEVINSCIKNEPIQEVDSTYDGYNQYPNLQSGSYANFTSIGKSLLTPYTSYPVPS